MGIYLEPQDGSKFDWIKMHGEPIKSGTFISKATSSVAVAFVDNGSFQALALMFCKQETQRFAAGRPDALWFKVPNARVQGLLGKSTWKYVE